MSENPYEAPQTFESPLLQTSDAERIRREHLNTEASVKALGTLYYLGSVMVAITLLGTFSNASSPGGGMMVAFLVLLLVVLLATAGALRKLKPWSRIVVGILSGLALSSYIVSSVSALFMGKANAGGLIGVLIGILINGYILRLVFGKKGRMVLSEPYREIVAVTPHVRYKTSKVVWILLGVIVAMFVAIMVVAIINRP